MLQLIHELAANIVLIKKHGNLLIMFNYKTVVKHIIIHS